MSFGLANFGKRVNITKSGILIPPTTPSTSTTTGSIVNNGGIGNAGALYNGGVVRVTDTTASSGPATGALTVGGGVGISGNLYVGSSGVVRVQNTTDSSTLSTGALVVSGGAAINGMTNISSGLNLHANTSRISFNNYATNKKIALWNKADDSTQFMGLGADSSSMRIQAMDTASGISLRCGTGTNTDQELMRVNGNLTSSNVAIYHTTESSSTSTGALTVNGGVGVAKNLNVGGKITASVAPSNPNDCVRLSDIGGAVISSGYLAGSWGQGGSGSNVNIHYQVQGNMWTICQKATAAIYTIQTTDSYLQYYYPLPSGYRPLNGAMSYIVCGINNSFYEPCVLSINNVGDMTIMRQSGGTFAAGT